jgi:hypothetical protein
MKEFSKENPNDEAQVAVLTITDETAALEIYEGEPLLRYGFDVTVMGLIGTGSAWGEDPYADNGELRKEYSWLQSLIDEGDVFTTK